MKTVVGLYETFTDAQAAIKDLVDAGFDRADISLVAANREEYRTDVTNAADVDDELIVDTNQLGDDVAAGMATGGVVGGLGGVLLGLGALAIPGVGPIIAAGPLVAGLTGAGIGAAVGGLVGALVNWGVPPAEAELYAESVRRGGILVGLKADESHVERAAAIMNRYDPIDVEQRSEYWRSTGWTGYDEKIEPWTADQMIADELSYSDYIDYSSYAPAFREHYTTTYGTTGRDYNWYDPAYRYGYTLANDERYGDATTWEEIEETASRGWAETEYAADHAWEDFKDAVRRGWEEVKDAFDFDSDYSLFEDGFRDHYTTTYRASGRDYDYYAPGYRYGYGLAMDERWDEYDNWDELEADARREWEELEDNAGNAWDDFKDAVRRAWEDVRDALDMEDDYIEHEPFFRSHYDERYRNGLRDYAWYEPAYRFGYISALDEHYDRYNTWDDRLEADIRRNWEASEYAAESTWDEIKDAVRRGWDSVRDALDLDDEEEGYATGTYTNR
jgi:hypothetical protein